MIKLLGLYLDIDYGYLTVGTDSVFFIVLCDAKGDMEISICLFSFYFYFMSWSKEGLSSYEILWKAKTKLYFELGGVTGSRWGWITFYPENYEE